MRFLHREQPVPTLLLSWAAVYELLYDYHGQLHCYLLFVVKMHYGSAR